jgi:hypothetical protein
VIGIGRGVKERWQVAETGEPGLVETEGSEVEAERGRIGRDAVVHVDGARIAAAGERQHQRGVR